MYSRARALSISRRRDAAARTRGSATRDTVPAPFPSTGIPGADSVAVATAVVAAVASAVVAVAARIARSLAKNPCRSASIPQLSAFRI